jgi:glycosyltransferase involved in cell wall biosynthesis
MKNDPLVSIIIPTSNRSAMLERAIKSILNQSYTEWEAIIVANGCKDDTEKVVASYWVDGRFRSINISEPVGGAKARNIGMDNARGEVLAFLDDDDEWLPQKLALQLEVIKNTDAPIVGCGYYLHKPGAPERIVKLKERVNIHDMFFENPIGSFSFCVTRMEYVKGLRINEKLSACQDWDLWVKILDREKREAMILDKPLVNYYEHAGSRLTTEYGMADRARMIFVKSHWKKMSGRQRKYQVLREQVLRHKKVEHGIFARIERAAVFLTVTKDRGLNIIYKAIIEYVLGLRSERLRSYLKSAFKRR